MMKTANEIQQELYDLHNTEGEFEWQWKKVDELLRLWAESIIDECTECAQAGYYPDTSEACVETISITNVKQKL